MAASKSNESAFSENGQHFANISADGRLKIWDFETGRPKQEFIPTAHLSASCTCIVWAPSKLNEQGSARKKKKQKRKANGETEASPSAAGSDLVALGTASGSILLYSLNRAELLSQLTGGHSDTVYSLCWNGDGSSLFSCSADRKVVEWNPLEGVIKSHWKVQNSPVFRICMLPDNKTLVTAGRTIYCWDVETRTVVATFSGHTTNVNHLVPVRLPAEESGYFLSAAEADRCISAWRFVGLEKKSQQSLASFALQDEPLNFAISRPASKKDPVVLVAVTVTGILHVYEHHLNGRTKKPLQPRVNIHIGCDTTGVARTLPVLAAHPLGDVDGHCLVVYGSLLQPGFEKLCYRQQDEMTYLIRRDPVSAADHSGSKNDLSFAAAMKSRPTILPSDVKTVSADHATPATAGDASVVTGRKRRNQNSESNSAGAGGGGVGGVKDSLPMEQRLSALNLDKNVDAVAPPTVDNMAQLLLQGLHSRDPKIIQSVLDRGDLEVINNTIRRIPVQAILPLISELTRMMQLRGHPNHSYAKWLRSLLEHHAGYLTSCPDLSTALTPLLALMTARTFLFPKLSQLRGRLDLMLGELKSRSEKQDPCAQLPATALLVYREESSDEASEEGDWPLQSGSESEDQWDELSDCGMDAVENKESDQEVDDDDSDVEDMDIIQTKGDTSDDDEEDVGDEESLPDESPIDDDDILENGLSD